MGPEELGGPGQEGGSYGEEAQLGGKGEGVAAGVGEVGKAPAATAVAEGEGGIVVGGSTAMNDGGGEGGDAAVGLPSGGVESELLVTCIMKVRLGRHCPEAGLWALVTCRGIVCTVFLDSQ
jgi:hypothetical protein